MSQIDSSESECNRFLGDLAALLLMVVGGTALVIWLSSLSHEERQTLVT